MSIETPEQIAERLVNQNWRYDGLVPLRNSIAAAIHAERERERADVCGDRDGVCFFCGNPTSMLAGNPSQWPLIFCFGDETGVAKTFHVGCVIKRLNRTEKAEHVAATAQSAAVQKIQECNANFDSLLIRAEKAERELAEIETILKPLKRELAGYLAAFVLDRVKQWLERREQITIERIKA